MFANIKSTYFVIMVFKLIDEKRALNTIKYNKRLQEKMNVSLLNYKLYYGKYIIFEDNGKAKEYEACNNILIFDGEYINGERNGKGKEYYFGKLEFEGEYLDGKRIRKGKIL